MPLEQKVARTLRLGTHANELDEIRVLHARTNLHRCDVPALSRRIAAYAASSQAARELRVPYKHYHFSEKIDLPEPRINSRSWGDVVAARRSSRQFAGPMDIHGISDLLGVLQMQSRNAELEGEHSISLRAYPSGGALYPVETYLAALQINSCERAFYYYSPLQHSLQKIAPICPETLKEVLVGADELIETAAGVLIFTCAFDRNVAKYGYRGYRFAIQESGLVAAMCGLNAASLGLAGVLWGGFLDNELRQLLLLKSEAEQPVATYFFGGIPKNDSGNGISENEAKP